MASLLYVGLFVLLPSGGVGCHLKDGLPWRNFSEKYYFPGKVMRSYLNLQIAKPPPSFIQAEAQPNAQFILACFPHGCGSEFRILMDGVIQNVMPNIVGKQNKLRTLAASILFLIPCIREIALWTGCIDANRKTASNALDKGRSLLILPGGEAEQIGTTYGHERIYLQSRKGFIKLAMRKQVPVVPVYVFGSSDLFYTSTVLATPRKWIQKKFGICLPLCFGLGGSLCPLPKTITIVFGDPLLFPMKDHHNTNDEGPTEEELTKAHTQFCTALITLFDLHKERVGYGDRTLELL